ncbi:IclR family transcriptional regulator [Actinomadura viridis]|uniref:IclR family transcriptional regulator n=1 Tax=Actinomadura viridis TaxID=58110 RepID=UPI0036CDC725
MVKGVKDGTSLDNAVPAHQTVRSVVKATQLLLLIADSDGIAVADLAREAGIPLTTVYHLVNTLLAEGMLTRDSARRYRLGPKIATLSMAYSKIGPSERLLAAVRELSQETGETAYLSGWRDGEVVALATIEGTSAVRVGRIHSELRGNEHARASGKLMLAYLDPAALDAYIESHDLARLTKTTVRTEAALRKQLAEIRKRGYAVEEGEFTDGVGCVSAPVMEGETVYGCLTVSTPLDRFNAHRDELIDAVLAAGRSASSS